MSGQDPDPEEDVDSSRGSGGQDDLGRGESDDVLEGQLVFKGPRKLRDLLNGAE